MSGNKIRICLNPKDVILDLFCGSGTGIDIGKDYDRKVIGFDLNPYRKDIIKFDVLTDKNPFLDRVLDHIFLDPPYFNMNKGKYTKRKTFSRKFEMFKKAILYFKMSEEHDCVKNREI